jgi:DNA uptake protein ComE-like DNA-binding protein
VALQGKKTAGSPDEWLLEPIDAPPDEAERGAEARDFVLDQGEQEDSRSQPEPIAAEDAQWLMEPNGYRNGQGTARTEPVEKETATAPAEPEGPGDGTALEEERHRNADLARRVTELEADLRSQAEEAEGTLARVLAEREAEFAAALRERDEALNERRAELEDQFSRRYEERKSGLTEEFDRKQAELEEHLTALEMRLDVREEELREQASRREAKLENRIRELQEQLADARLGTNEAERSKRPRRRASGGNGNLDVNEVSFEQLRELGLSITQSARVIAYRDTRGGFDSLDELDEIPGLPKETRSTLKDLLSF